MGTKLKQVTHGKLLWALFAAALSVLICVFIFELKENQRIINSRLPAEIPNKIWIFGKRNIGSYSDSMKLTGGGKITGYSHPNEQAWSISNNCLLFYNINGEVSTIFDEVSIPNGVWRLSSKNGHELLENTGNPEDIKTTELKLLNLYPLKLALALSVLFLLFLITPFSKQFFQYLRKYPGIFKKNSTLTQKLLTHIETYGILYIVLLFCIIQAFYSGFIGIWDAGIYIEELTAAVQKPFHILNFNIAGHLSFGYMLIMGLGQWLDPGNPYLLHLENAVLASTSIFFFYRTLPFFFREQKKPGILLLTALYAFNPVFTGNLVNLNLDTAVVLFFVWTLYALVRQKMIFFMVSSVLMMTSKESGLLLYFMLLGSYVLLFLFKRLYAFFTAKDKFKKTEVLNSLLNSDKSAGRRNAVIFRLTLLFLPLILFLLYYFYKTGILKEGALWENTSLSIKSFDFLFHIDLTNTTFLTRLIQLFILNFQWIMSAFILAFIFKKAFHYLSGRKAAVRFTDQRKDLFLVLVWVFAGFALFNSLYQTYVNPRYLLPAVPLLIIIYNFCLTDIVKKEKVRTAVSAACLVLVFVQNFFSADPLSAAVFKTFDFGRHKMYRIVSLTKEEYGIGGRDQLVYNLQFTAIHGLVNQIYARIGSSGASILSSDYGDFYIFTPADKNSLKRAYRLRDAVSPISYPVSFLTQSAPASLPQSVYYINLPWMERFSNEFPVFLEYYMITNNFSVRFNGYELPVYEGIKKTRRPPPLRRQ